MKFQSEWIKEFRSTTEVFNPLFLYACFQASSFYPHETEDFCPSIFSIGFIITGNHHYIV